MRWLLSRSLGISGPESLSISGNIFLGQTEAPLLIKAYLEKMNRSEILLVMVGGMATVAGGVLAAYIGFLGGNDPALRLEFARHLIAASVMAAPGAIVISKILYPQTEAITSEIRVTADKIGSNLLDAIANGTTEGLKLAVNVGAMLLAACVQQVPPAAPAEEAPAEETAAPAEVVRGFETIRDAIRMAGEAVAPGRPGHEIDAIAREHERGRRLFIGTVNLDAGRSVIWNIGEIAASDYPQKIALIREILRASAAIPVAFPPVMISVEAEGGQYDEMHVDGGTGSQVFVYPAAIDWGLITEKLKVHGRPQVYVIRNSFLDPDYNGIRRSVFPIASRTIDSLIRTQGIGDIYQIYALCKRDGNDFHLAYIPSDFTAEPAEGFDPVYMKKLLDYGY